MISPASVRFAAASGLLSSVLRSANEGRCKDADFQLQIGGAKSKKGEPMTNETSDAPASVEVQELAERLRVERALTANHANTLPMLEILRACAAAGEPRPYREVEDQVYDLPVMLLSHQNAHTLALMLVDCGALERIDVPEQLVEGGAVADRVAPVAELSIPGETSATASAACVAALDQLEDQPVDYLLGITPAGAAALETFEPAKRYCRMLAGEPSVYRDIYRKVLTLCESGNTIDEIESSLVGEPAMRTPKTVYAGHFVSNLETVGGITWDDDRWVTTAHGRQMASL